MCGGGDSCHQSVSRPAENEIAIGSALGVGALGPVQSLCCGLCLCLWARLWLRLVRGGMMPALRRLSGRHLRLRLCHVALRAPEVETSERTRARRYIGAAVPTSLEQRRRHTLASPAGPASPASLGKTASRRVPALWFVHCREVERSAGMTSTARAVDSEPVYKLEYVTYFIRL